MKITEKENRVIHEAITYAEEEIKKRTGLTCILKIESVFEHKEPVTAEKITQVVSDYYQLPYSEVVGGNRDAKYVEPRHIAIYLICRKTTASLKEVGKLLGGRHYSSIIHARDKVMGYIDTYPDFKMKVEHIKSIIEKQTQ